MSITMLEPGEVVSPVVYSLILTSPYLQQLLLPEGLTSPYEILDYDATLTLHDQQGRRATFQRTQHIRFLQDGVAGLLDHAWGQGVLVTNYQHSAGQLEESFKDQGRRHLVVELPRATRRGEQLRFTVRRDVLEAFRGATGVVETTIDHPIQQLRRTVIFPSSRPVRQASAQVEGQQWQLPITWLPDGRTLVRLDVPNPRAHTIYTVRWSW
jgi:hypothetical protein